MTVEHFGDLGVYRVALTQDFIKLEPTYYISQTCLGNLIDSHHQVFDSHEALDRVYHFVIGHGGDVHRHVVFGDNLLRWDGQGHGAQVHPPEHAYVWDNPREARLLHPRDFTQEKDNPLLVLLDYA